jgi:hypothetical protein
VPHGVLREPGRPPGEQDLSAHHREGGKPQYGEHRRPYGHDRSGKAHDDDDTAQHREAEVGQLRRRALGRLLGQPELVLIFRVFQQPEANRPACGLKDPLARDEGNGPFGGRSRPGRQHGQDLRQDAKQHHSHGERYHAARWRVRF